MEKDKGDVTINRSKLDQKRIGYAARGLQWLMAWSLQGWQRDADSCYKYLLLLTKETVIHHVKNSRPRNESIHHEIVLAAMCVKCVIRLWSNDHPGWAKECMQ